MKPLKKIKNYNKYKLHNTIPKIYNLTITHFLINKNKSTQQKTHYNITNI